jgi:hypothetical protein
VHLLLHSSVLVGELETDICTYAQLVMGWYYNLTWGKKGEINRELDELRDCLTDEVRDSCMPDHFVNNCYKIKSAF